MSRIALPFVPRPARRAAHVAAMLAVWACGPVLAAVSEPANGVPVPADAGNTTAEQPPPSAPPSPPPLPVRGPDGRIVIDTPSSFAMPEPTAPPQAPRMAPVPSVRATTPPVLPSVMAVPQPAKIAPIEPPPPKAVAAPQGAKPAAGKPPRGTAPETVVMPVPTIVGDGGKPATPPATSPGAPPGASVAPATAPAVKAPAAPVPADRLVRVAFQPGSVEVPPSATGTVAQLTERMRTSETLRLELRCYAAGTADTAREARKLSLARGLALRAELVARGVRSTRVDIRALGALASDGPADRVDIVLVD